MSATAGLKCSTNMSLYRKATDEQLKTSMEAWLNISRRQFKNLTGKLFLKL